MGEFILVILNMSIIFFILKFFIKITKKKIQDCNISKWNGSDKKIKFKIGTYMMILCMCYLWLIILGKFHIISCIIFIVMVGFIILIGALS